MTGPLQDYTIDLIEPEPGQTVVVTVAKLPAPHILEAMGEQLKRSFPDNRCVVMEEGTALSVEDDQLRDLLSACKQWRHATKQRLRHLNSRNEAVPLLVDQALFDAIDKAEGK